jgi:hypothetical protein
MYEIVQTTTITFNSYFKNWSPKALLLIWICIGSGSKDFMDPDLYQDPD